MPMPSAFPCPDELHGCDCSEFPVRNFSMAESDTPIFFGHHDQPPNIGTFFAPGCLGLCESRVSQEEADECAADQAFLCAAPPGVPVFPNRAQTCIIPCPDGLPFSWTVPAGAIPGNFLPLDGGAGVKPPIPSLRITAPDVIARCLESSAPSLRLRIGGGYTDPADVYRWHWGVTDGELPPGVTLISSTGDFFGAPTAAGHYDFKVAVSNIISGVLDEVWLTFRVLDITTPSALPDAFQGVPYGPVNLSAAGTDPENVWSIAPIASPDNQFYTLPPGLSLSSGGVISGTPFNVESSELFGVYNPQIRLRDSDGQPSIFSASCVKFFTINFQP